MALSVLFYMFLRSVLCKNKIGGPLMNINEYRRKIYRLLEKLKTEEKEAERILIVEQIQEMLSALLPD